VTARLVLLPLALLAVACSSDDPSPATTESATTELTTPVVATTELTTTSFTTTTIVQGPTGLMEGSIVTPDGRQRSYRLYVPPSLPPGPVPLVIALHGGTGSGAQFQRTSGLDEIADMHGFIAVYPDGTGQLRTWNAGYCCGAAQRQNVDDVAFIRQLIETIEISFSIDQRGVYAMGHSNGGMLAYRLACELSDRIAAVALQAGSLGVDECAPSSPVSLLHIHGTADTNHPIEGGVGSDSISGVSYRSARESVSAVAAADGCGEPAELTDPANPDVSLLWWTSCDDGAEVRLEMIEGATHAWMGHDSPNPAADPPYRDLDATLSAVSFLLDHRRPG
jgi:polyhydroxybutyrate depolymerase